MKQCQIHNIQVDYICYTPKLKVNRRNQSVKKLSCKVVLTLQVVQSSRLAAYIYLLPNGCCRSFFFFKSIVSILQESSAPSSVYIVQDNLKYIFLDDDIIKWIQIEEHCEQYIPLRFFFFCCWFRVLIGASLDVPVCLPGAPLTL